MVTSFQAESEEGGDGVFDDAPRREVPEPEATPRGGWNPLLEVREVTPTDFLKGVFTDCVWVRSLTPLPDDPLVHRAGLTYLSDIGTGFGQQDAALVGPRRAVHRPLHVVPGAHPRRRLGPGRPAARQGAQRAWLLPGLAARPDGRLGATLYQEHLLLPGVDVPSSSSEVAAGPRREAARPGRDASRADSRRDPAGAAGEHPGRDADAHVPTTATARTEGHCPACRSPSPKTTAPWGRRPRTSWPSTTPAARPGPCSRPRPRRCPPFWGDLAALGWLGLHLPEDVGGLGLRPARARRRGRGAGPGRGARALRADGDRQRGHRRGRVRRAAGAAPARTGRRVGPRRRRARRRTSRCRGARPPGRRRRCWAVASPMCSCCRRATTPSWSTRRRAGCTVEVPANLDPTRRSARVTLDGAAVEVIAGGRAGARRPGAGARGRRGHRRRHRVHRAGGGLRQGARAVRPAHRHVPGRQAPLRQHARGRPSWPRPPCGTRRGRPTRAATSCRYAAAVAAALALGAGDECANLNIQVHGGIGFTWEHDAHLYLRRATALEAIVDARGGGARRHGPRAARDAAGAHDRPAARGRADARRGAGVRRAGAGAGRRGAARGA